MALLIIPTDSATAMLGKFPKLVASVVPSSRESASMSSPSLNDGSLIITFDMSATNASATVIVRLSSNSELPA